MRSMSGFKSMVIGLMMVFLPALTTGGLAAEAKLTHFSYGSHGASWHEYLNVMAKAFQEETGITVEIEAGPTGSGYATKLITMVAGGVVPDVTDFNPNVGADLVYQGFFADLRPFINRDNLPLKDIPPMSIEGFQVPDGSIWGLPVSVYPVITFFNVDMFAAAGLHNPVELGENWTWDTMLQSAKRLTQDTNGDGTIDQWGTDRVTSRYEMQVHQAGGQLYDRIVYPTKSQWNTPQVVAAFQFLQTFQLEKLISASGGFWSGKAAIDVVDGPGIIGTYLQNVDFSWNVALQPKGPANRALRVNPDGFQIMAQSNNKDLAWQWIRFLVNSAERQTTMARITGRFPSLRQAMFEYRNLGFTKIASNWTAIVEASFDPNGYAAYVIPYSAEINPVINPVLNQMWAGNISAQMACEQIHEAVSIILAEKFGN